MSTMTSFKSIEDKRNVYRGKDCMKIFCESYWNEIETINKRTTKIIFVKNNLKVIMRKIKKYHNVKDHCHYAREYSGAAHSQCNLKYGVTRQILEGEHLHWK